MEVHTILALLHLPWFEGVHCELTDILNDKVVEIFPEGRVLLIEQVDSRLRLADEGHFSVVEVLLELLSNLFGCLIEVIGQVEGLHFVVGFEVVVF